MRLLLVVPGLALAAACSSSSSPAGAPATTALPTYTTFVPSSTTTAPAPLGVGPTSSTTVVPGTAACPAADPAEVVPITAALSGGAKRLGEAVAVKVAPSGWIYVGANIYDEAGTRVSNDDVWIIDSAGAAYALSGGRSRVHNIARRPKAAGSPSAGDQHGQAVQDCTPNNR